MLLINGLPLRPGSEFTLDTESTRVVFTRPVSVGVNAPVPWVYQARPEGIR